MACCSLCHAFNTFTLICIKHSNNLALLPHSFMNWSTSLRSDNLRLLLRKYLWKWIAVLFFSYNFYCILMAVLWFLTEIWPRKDMLNMKGVPMLTEINCERASKQQSSCLWSENLFNMFCMNYLFLLKINFDIIY